MALTSSKFVKEVSDGAKSIKQTFQQWDADGSGTISKEELTGVMRQICPMTDREIDLLMKEADLNKNGVIEYSEFVDWLTKPASESYGRALLEYSSMLRPLFEVYDRDCTGTIKFHEFEECHCILQNSLKLHPMEEGAEGANVVLCDPMDLQKDAQEAFRLADATRDGVITFTDFVDWMREHLDAHDLSADDLARLAAKLSQMLAGIFKLKQLAQEDPGGRLSADEERVLARLIENLAKTMREFERAVSDPPIADAVVAPKVPGSSWTEPPVGLSVERLKGAHMKYRPLNTRHVAQVEFEVLCVPMPGNETEPDKRRWVGEVVRRVTYSSERRTVEPPRHYIYEREHFRWLPLPSSEEYEQALEKLPPELGVFCVLKTEADFGGSLDWDGVQSALRGAVVMDFITSEQHAKYTRHMEERVMCTIAAEQRQGTMTPAAGGMRRRAQELLSAKVKLRPLEVMAMLTELEIVPVSAAWKDFVKPA